MKKPSLRMCVACRQMQEKSKLIRIVKIEGGMLELDLTGKKDGRGAYICNLDACLKKAIKSRLLNRSFKTNVDPSLYEQLAGLQENKTHETL